MLHEADSHVWLKVFRVRKEVWVLRFFGLGFSLMLALSSAAERMNVETHTLVIDKLEGALQDLPKSSPERRSIAVRLADLYADRARFLLLAKQDQKCADCPDGSQDRKRAIALYGQVEGQLSANDQGPILVQMAHLQNIQGQSAQAEKTLERATNTHRFPQEITARAHSNLGEIQFRKAKFKNAEKHFQQALAYSGISNPGFITYRLAWSQLNQGKSTEATATLVRLLKTPELLTTENQSGVTFDHAFHEDVTRDLVVFLARGQVNAKEIDLLMSLTPEALRKENLYALANELERLGKKQSATLAWSAYHEEGDSSPHEALETQIRLAQLKWDMGKKDEALTEYGKVAQIWTRKGCTGGPCEDLGKRFKNFVITWNKVEKDKPSVHCLAAYQHYLSVFSQDAEMYFKAATVAHQLSRHGEATTLYAKAAGLIAADARAGRPINQELLDAALLQQIESAEMTKDKKARLAAYVTYLEMNPQGSKAVEVKYQKAQVTYEMGQTESAFHQFSQLAQENPNDQRALRVKSADLALDALATQKNDQALYEWAPRLAAIYPERTKEYSKIQSQAAIHLAGQSLDQKSSAADLRKEYTRLNTISLATVSPADRVTILKNRIALALRLHDLAGVEQASLELYATKNLKPQDQELALSNLTWVAELKLDFKKALIFGRKMKFSSLDPDERHLRLAMWMELAGENPKSEYERALAATRSRATADSIRATLVRRAKNPWSELKKHGPRLRHNAPLLAALVTETYGRAPNDRQAWQFLKSQGLKSSSLGKLLARQEFFAKWKRQDQSLERHRLSTNSDALLQKSLTERISRLQQVDRLGREALNLSDWGSQLVVLSTVARENKRLHSELMRLPVPAKLNKLERQQYTALLTKKAAPFAVRAKDAEKKLVEFWKNDQAIRELTTAIENSKGRVHELLSTEALTLARLTNGAPRRRLEAAVRSSPDQPTNGEIAEARHRLAKDPFDTGVAEQLKQLAKKRGETTMVAYLDARIQQLKKGVNR